MIEFLEKQHLYLVNGILVPSVTQILQLIFPNKYRNVNQYILNKKAVFGATGHLIIEHLDVNNLEQAKKKIRNIEDIDLQICIREYLRLVKKFEIVPDEQEQIVNYEQLYCGTLDMTGYVLGKHSLLDVKFTAELDKEYLSWQLGMYGLAKGIEYEKYYCIWLPKGKLGQLVEIVPKHKKEILEKLEELKKDGKM